MTQDFWQTTLFVAWGTYVAGLAVWIILQKRSPAATVSWILLLAWVPLLGYLIYYFFGPQRLKRFRLRRLRSRLSLAAQADAAHAHEAAYEDSGPLQGLARLAYASCDNPLSTAHEVSLLVDGEQTFDAIFEAIRQARRHIHAEYYIFEADTTGTALRDLLAERAAEGVTVRLLVDALGAPLAGGRFFKPLVDAGGQVAYFHATRIGRRLRPVINFRTHRKIVVCDGQVGFTGGLNVTDDQDERIDPNAYHDVHLRLKGGAVRWLQMVFLEDWVYATRHGENVEFSPGDHEDYMPHSEPGSRFVQILHSGPNDPREAIYRVQVAAIHNATEKVWLTTPYFVPPQPAMMSLTSAAMRGVDVRVLVPRRSDSRIVTAAARSYFDELIEAGVKVWEYPDRMLHSKTLLVDSECSFVGTANFDNRSFRLNYEVCALVYGPELAEDLARQFEKDLSSATMVQKSRNTSIFQRLFEACCRLFSPIL